MDDQKKIKFKYIFQKDYNPIYINGLFGGITPRGEIVINFFLERHGLPISQTHEINEIGLIEKEIGREPEDHRESMVRFVEQGIILNLQNAKALNQWLEEYISKLENALKEEIEEKK